MRVLATGGVILTKVGVLCVGTCGLWMCVGVWVAYECIVVVTADWLTGVL